MKTRVTLAAAASLALAALSGCATTDDPPPTTGTVVPSSGSSYYPATSSYGQTSCYDCGTVQSVTPRTTEEKINVAGAIAGAIIGGVAGHQVGSGRGQDAATAGGAVAGAAIGSQVGRDGTTVYDMSIRMDSGEYRSLTVANTEGLSPGTRVRVTGSQVVRI